MKAVRKGGIVAYATCSWHLAETEYVIEDLLKQRNDVRLLDANIAVSNIAHLKNAESIISPDFYFRLWPHIHDTDGMFVALLTRE
jgi:16S rRNA (cytosine967-C5)-methyltransferase